MTRKIITNNSKRTVVGKSTLRQICDALDTKDLTLAGKLISKYEIECKLVIETDDIKKQAVSALVNLSVTVDNFLEMYKSICDSIRAKEVFATYAVKPIGKPYNLPNVKPQTPSQAMDAFAAKQISNVISKAKDTYFWPQSYLGGQAISDYKDWGPGKVASSENMTAMLKLLEGQLAAFKKSAPPDQIIVSPDVAKALDKVVDGTAKKYGLNNIKIQIDDKLKPETAIVMSSAEIVMSSADVKLEIDDAFGDSFLEKYGSKK